MGYLDNKTKYTQRLYSEFVSRDKEITSKDSSLLTTDHVYYETRKPIQNMYKKTMTNLIKERIQEITKLTTKEAKELEGASPI